LDYDLVAVEDEFDFVELVVDIGLSKLEKVDIT